MLRILYVEDNAANLSLVHRVARLGGHEVVNRTSGESALADFAAIKPDLVLMDIQLEGRLSGLDVVRQLRADGYTAVPIIAVTAYAMMGDMEKAISAGCDDYLPKPLPITQLVDLIKHYQVVREKRRTGEIPLSRPPKGETTPKAETKAETQVETTPEAKVEATPETEAATRPFRPRTEKRSHEAALAANAEPDDSPTPVQEDEENAANT